jgi:hypothetical protein
MAGNSPTVILEARRGSALLKSGQFNEPSITIGRSGSAMFTVDAPELADLHAVLNVEEDCSVALLDLGSPTGVFFKGEKISNATLASGDSFMAGALMFRVMVYSADDFEEESATRVEARPGNLSAPPAPGRDIDDHTEEAAHQAPVAAAQHEEEEEERTAGKDEAPAAHAAADDAGEAHAEEDDDHGDHADHEDVLAFVMKTTPGQVSKKAKVLEINQMWGNLLVDTRQFPADGRDVSIGASLGYRWRLLGVDMGWVPAPLGMTLPMVMPLWSDVLREWKNDFYVPVSTLPSESDYTLFSHPEPGQYVANVAKGWDGFVDVEDKRYSFEELVNAGKAKKSSDGGYEVPLSEDMRLTVDAAGQVFFAHFASHDPRLVARLTDDVDYPFVGMMAFGVFVFASIGLTMAFMPPLPSNNTNEIDERLVELMLQKPEEEKKEQKKPDANPDAGEGAKAKKEEGKVGKEKAKLDKAKGNKVEIKQQEIDREIAEQAGVLGAMADSNLDQILGASGLSSELRGGIGGLIGAKGSQLGSGGLGARGGGLGGGGTAEGLGGLGTKGMGSGASGYGKGGGNFGAKGEGGIGTVGGDPIILGALDRSLIDEVIKRHMNQIRYCYQRELTKNPALGGKIVIKFVIAKDGTVSSAEKKTSTMNNSAVEQCIVGRFMRMVFPQPKGGGIVIVSYPFIFSPG